MKASSYIFWILAAAMVIASVDTIPDPPAINPHTAVSHMCEVGSKVCDQGYDRGWFCFSAHLQASRIALLAASEPSLPTDWIVSTGNATDSSPPAFISHHNFQI
jgi:hypothetical protein